jgi:hypothetical protein
LEEERRAAQQDENERPSASGEVKPGIPLHRKQHPKCVNSACPTAFHWLAGGKFFRFWPDDGSAAGHHGVQHYWLCEHCSHVFTLIMKKNTGLCSNFAIIAQFNYYRDLALISPFLWFSIASIIHLWSPESPAYRAYGFKLAARAIVAILLARGKLIFFIGAP